MSEYALKFLREDAVSPAQGFAWPTPRGSRPGKWVKAKGPLVVCQNGIHALRFDVGLFDWMNNPELWVIEIDGEITYSEDKHKLVARRGRLIRRVEEWNEQNTSLFAADCAYLVLPIFEAQCPHDKRPRDAIRAARAYARHPTEKNRERRDAAGDAAGAAARDIAGDAAWDAAWAAARAAAGDAARAAAGAAARAAARAAAWDVAGAAARAAAGAAARAAARDIAGDAAWDAAWDVARDVQLKLLAKYLSIPEVPYA